MCGTAHRDIAEESVRLYEYAQMPESAFVEVGQVEASWVNSQKSWRGVDMAAATRALLQHKAFALGGTAVIVTSFVRDKMRECASGIAIRYLIPTRSG